MPPNLQTNPTCCVGNEGMIRQRKKGLQLNPFLHDPKIVLFTWPESELTPPGFPSAAVAACAGAALGAGLGTVGGTGWLVGELAWEAKGSESPTGAETSLAPGGLEGIS